AYEPVLKPTFAEFPSDRRCYEENDDMLIGASLLVAPVVEQGQRERSVYLPAGARWVSYWSGEVFEGGQTVTLPAPWDQPVMLIREGG
ncbi:family 31 glucosidase, partial [Acinetobacter baumannii]